MRPNQLLSIPINLAFAVAAFSQAAPPAKPAQSAPAKPAQSAPAQNKSAVPALTLATVTINPVHEGDSTVQGISPLANVALTLTVNSTAAGNPQTADIHGSFTFPISKDAPLKAGNWVTVAGMSGTTPVSGNTTVLAARLSKPTITAAVGGKNIVVARNDADSGVVGLKIVLVGHGGMSCSPDDKTGTCTITISTALKAGDTVQAHENVQDTNGPDATLALAIPTLAKPVITAATERDRLISVTADKGDLGRSGLSLVVTIQPGGAPMKCSPDTSTGVCSIAVDPLAPNTTIEAYETSDDLTSGGPKAEAHVAALAALGKPAISPANEGDETVKVTLNSNDKTPGLLITVLLCGPANALGTCLPLDPSQSVPNLTSYTCPPSDANGSCSIPLKLPLIAGDSVQAWETLNGRRRPADPFATVTVGGRAALNIPIIGPVKESDTAVKITLNSDDIQKWGTNLTVHTSLYSAGQAIATKTCSPSANQDNCSVTFDSPLAAGQVLHAYVAATPPTSGTDTGSQAQPNLNLPSKPGPEVVLTVPELGFDWGRARAYFSLGAVFSRSTTTAATSTTSPVTSTTSFSSPDIFAGLDMDFTWLTTQKCITYPFDGDHIKLATLADAADQCASHGRGSVRKAAGPDAGTRSGNPGPPSPAASTPAAGTQSSGSPADQTGGLDVLESELCDRNGHPKSTIGLISDPALAKAVEFLCRIGSNAMPPRLLAARTSLSAAAVGYTAARQGRNLTSRAEAAASLGFTQTMQTYALTQRPAVETAFGIQARRVTDALEARQNARAALSGALDDLLKQTAPTDASNAIQQKARELQRAMQAEASSEFQERQKRGDFIKALNTVASLELTSDEARGILAQFGYEKEPEKGLMLNSYVSTRLTQTQASNGFTLSNSANSVHLESGVYLPLYTTWSRWPYKSYPYALYAAPLAKLGFDSLRLTGTDAIFIDAQTPPPAGALTPAQQAQQNYQTAVNSLLGKDIFRMMAFGGRVGLFQLSSTPHRAPESIMYIDVTYGRYDNFFAPKYSSDNLNGGVRYPWRFGLNSRFQIPGTIFYIGSDLTKGVGPDSLSIYVGARADLSALLAKLIPTTSK